MEGATAEEERETSHKFRMGMRDGSIPVLFIDGDWVIRLSLWDKWRVIILYCNPIDDRLDWDFIELAAGVIVYPAPYQLRRTFWVVHPVFPWHTTSIITWLARCFAPPGIFKVTAYSLYLVQWEWIWRRLFYYLWEYIPHPFPCKHRTELVLHWKEWYAQ